MCFKATLQDHPIIKENPYKSLTIKDLNIRFYKNIDDIADFKYLPSSQKIISEHNIFLSPDFQRVLKQTPPFGFQFCYLTFHKKEQFVGFVACQIKNFDASESLNFDGQQNYILLAVRKWLARRVHFQTLIVGNLLLTGENSYWFDNQLVTDEDKNNFLSNGIQFVKKALSEENIFIKSVFIKDFFEPQKSLITEGYNEFQVEPNFIMPIHAVWHSFEHYLEALSSKYRVRAKRAFKKLQGIEKKEFNEERIIANKLKINALYRNIADKSSFNLVDLNEDYFVEMKRQLGDKFRFFGYYTNAKNESVTASGAWQEGGDNNNSSPELVGFFTTIQNGEVLEAHFLGYDESLNHSHQIYLNFLFDIIKNGIDNQSKSIVFARTAHEIKSSVGAQAHDMYLYMRHENPIINRLLPYFLKILSPREDWQPRQPFKEN